MQRFLNQFVILAFVCAPRVVAEELVTVFGQPAWTLSSDSVELAVTQTGGHMAPVTFARTSQEPVRPYYISPWQEEGLTLDPPVLVPLRGDFFCMPFGGNGVAFQGEQHPPHGEVAGSEWTFVGRATQGGVHTLTLVLETKARPGTVVKELSLVDGQNVIYSTHTITGFTGPTPLGHHATLRLPDEPGTFKVQSSVFEFGMTNPLLFSDPEKREYQSLQIGHRFTSLDSIPTIWKDSPTADCSLYPARTGFADLLAIFKQPAADGSPAWMTAINREEGYLWFSLKSPTVLPATVFWIENHGRHASPWNGRNRCLGLEDVCAFFAEGLVPSVEENLLKKAGVRTVVQLPGEGVSTQIRYIQGAVRVPKGFDAVDSIRFSPGEMKIVSSNGIAMSVQVQHEFLRTGQLR